MRTEKFKNIFWFAPKSNIKAGDGLDKGRFPFYTSSPKLTKWIDKEQHFDEALIFGTGGLASVHFEDQPFSTSTDCIVAITTNKEIKTKFVYYYLFGNIHLLERGFKGAGLKHISKKYIENLDIPILPIETQNKIVAVLDKASALVSKREQIESLIEELILSNFLKIFGDPGLNNNYETLGDYIVELTDYHANGSYEILRDNVELKREPDYALMVRTTELENNVFDKEANYIDEKTYNFLSKSKVYGGEIIINKIGSAGKVYRMPFLNRPVSLGMNAFLLRFSDDVSHLYAYYFLTSKFGALEISKRVKGAVTKTIRKDAIRNIPFLKPPKDKQVLFEVIYNKILTIKSNSNISKNELIALNNSIVQKVFNGELNFNIDIELDALIKEIDLQKKENDLSKIVTDFAYLQRLIDKLNGQEFKERELYDKAKHAVFQLLKEDVKIIQEYDENSKSLKLAMK